MQLTQKIKGVPGYSFAGINLGIKDQTLDFGCIHCEVPAIASAVFTQNLFQGAPILIGKNHIQDQLIQTIVVNSKNANVYTGHRGEQDTLEICREIKNQFNLKSTDLVFPSSTGIIGQFLPMKKLLKGCREIKSRLSFEKVGIDLFARSIMTTDRFPKWQAVKIGSATLLGIAKGAGMIHPNMATMLAYFVTDAQIEQADLTTLFRQAVKLSFNAISVDGDTSTSDTALIMASGISGKVDRQEFKRGLCLLAQHLAQEIVRDGEGSRKVIELQIRKVVTLEQADLIAKSILNSPLVKTAIAGADPNWGRIIMAIGKIAPYIKPREEIDPDQVKIYLLEEKNRILLNDLQVIDSLKRTEQLKKVFQEEKITLQVDIGNGQLEKTFWGCDLNENYLKINSEYTT